MAAFREFPRAETTALTLVLVALALLALPDKRQQALARRTNHVLLLPISKVRETFGGYLELREQNAELRISLQRAQLELSRTESVRLENRELEALLEFKGKQAVRLQPTRVIGRNFGALPTIFLIDVGREDGITENLPVVTANGLVGKTFDVGPATSQVMLYTHPDFSASALLVGGEHLEYGVVRSRLDGELQLFLPLRSHSEPGDRIVTSGYGGAFPRGIPLGEVIRLMEDQRLGLQRIDLVRPVVDLGEVTAAFVLVRASSPGKSAGGSMGLFWPGYAYPPIEGEQLGAEPESEASSAGQQS